MEFVDLARQRDRLQPGLDQAIAKVLAEHRFILGPEVAEFEKALCDYCEVGHAVTCGNGTDALVLVLMAWGIGPGDAVYVPAFSYAASAEAVLLTGATPVLVDVQGDTFNIDVADLRLTHAATLQSDLTPRAVIPVDLFGTPADYGAVEAFGRETGLKVLCDGAQSFGARRGNRMVGRFGDATTTSFFPAKPLGCYGDGGAIFTEDEDLAERLRSLRFHGKGGEKYDHVRIGMNSRLDTLQAAILLQKLSIFADEVDVRNRIAARYAAGLSDLVTTPDLGGEFLSSWAQFTLRTEKRDHVRTVCAEAGIPTMVYYPKALHRQTAYLDCPTSESGLPVSDVLPHEVVSLPMHPYLTDDEIDLVIDTVAGALR